MTDVPLVFQQAPRLSDKSANDVHEFLLELLGAFENSYYGQLQRYDQQREEQWLARQTQPTVTDPVSTDPFDDELPDF